MQRLYDLCLLKISYLLRNTYWNECPYEDNPFATLPKAIVNDLVAVALYLFDGGKLKLLDLQHLLTSGQVANFHLAETTLDQDELVQALVALNPRDLKSLVLLDVKFSFTEIKECLTTYEALNHLLFYSCQLEEFSTSVEFDFAVLRNCLNLKKLVLHKFTEYDDFPPMPVLENLEIHESDRHPLRAEQSAAILKNCPRLKWPRFNLAHGLEWMYGDEFAMAGAVHDVTLLLMGIQLGSSSFEDGPATESQVRLAIALCPLLTEVNLLTSQHEAVSELRAASQLSTLQVQWDAPEGGDFRLSVKELLNLQGSQLDSLDLKNFRCVDFVSLTQSCPNLTELRVEYISAVTEVEPGPTSSKCPLQTFYLENTSEDGAAISESALRHILLNSRQLGDLSLIRCPSMNDEVLKSSIDNLKELRQLTLTGCSLSEVGVRRLAAFLPHLAYLHMSSSLVEFERIVEIVHELNESVVIVELGYEDD